MRDLSNVNLIILKGRAFSLLRGRIEHPASSGSMDDGEFRLPGGRHLGILSLLLFHVLCYRALYRFILSVFGNILAHSVLNPKRPEAPVLTLTIGRHDMVTAFASLIYRSVI
jgi:hypothetical protein